MKQPKLEKLCKWNSMCILRGLLKKDYCTKHYSKSCPEVVKYEQQADEHWKELK